MSLKMDSRSGYLRFTSEGSVLGYIRTYGAHRRW